jgi:activator of HSP90 ATPase
VRKLIAAALAAAVIASPLAAPASAQSLTITPAAGSQSDTFTIEGTGLPAGLALDINFQSPSGEVFSTAALNKVVVVDPEGDFTFEVNPTVDFAGQPTGTWLVQVCAAGTDQCAQTDFNIGG